MQYRVTCYAIQGDLLCNTGRPAMQSMTFIHSGSTLHSQELLILRVPRCHERDQIMNLYIHHVYLGRINENREHS